MPSIIKTPLPKRKKKALTAAQREVIAQAEATQKALAKLPKFGDKYTSSNKKKKVAPTKVRPVQIKKPSLEAQRLAERLAEARSTPSLKSTDNQTGKSLPKRYDGDLAKREEKARARKFAVAPAYNKGGLQLITNEEDYKTMGRKI